MSRLDDLPPDQRAALSLLLRRGKGYAEVASLLQIQERAVHDRAHAALAVLAPREARELTPEHRQEIGDYLLGQRPGVAERLRTRSFLDGSAPGRAWAKAIAAQLAPLASSPLPEIPGADGAHPDGDAPLAAPAAPRAGTDGPAPTRAPASLPSSRIGGAVLLAAILAGVIVAIVLATGGGSHKRASSTPASASKPAGGSSASGGGAGKATENRRITLRSPDPASKAAGVAEVLSEGKTYAFYMAAEHLPPSKGFFYAVWLYNSPTGHEALSKSPPVGADGRLQGGALLPPDAGSYHQMILTKETSEHPTQPGPIVLRGSFGLH